MTIKKIFRKKRKALSLSVAAIILLLCTLYFFIPSQLVFSKSILILTNQNSLNRFLSDSSKVDNWWAFYENAHPGTKIKSVKFQHYYLSNLVNANIYSDEKILHSEIRIVPVDKDSTYIDWKVEQSLPSSPIKRFGALMEKKSLENDLQKILNSLKQYTERSVNIYGFQVEKTKVKDTLIAVAKYVLDAYPSTSFIYEKISRLKLYLLTQQVVEKDFPMLHVTNTYDGRFEIMIGIPVSKTINSSEEVFIQKMVTGDILTTECNGGPSTIRSAVAEVENYMQDYGKSSPALPFELLITDRMKNQDTLNWVTRIYYPVY